MKQYQTFIFDSYSFDEKAGTIELRYSLDDEITFVETLRFPQALSPAPLSLRGEGPGVRAALFALHIIGGISYFKTCIPKKFEIRSGSLDEEQAKFWNSVYENGLGEFFYRNEIDFRGLINFPHDTKPETRNQKPETKSPISAPPIHSQKSQILVPIGGGKDSIVTIELLKKAGYDVTLFRLGHHPYIDYIAHRANLPLLTVERALPKNLFELNEQGALNGHVPITAYLSFLSILIAELYGFDAVAMSNERSANEGNVKFHGKEINHQWSKSLEFEQMFQEYVRENITPTITYFSLLRPLSELAITKKFTEHPAYFEITTSCNKNWRLMKKCLSEERKECPENGLWCGKCPKCAFVYCLLGAFLPRTTLDTLFHKNLFNDAALLSLYRQLLGLEGSKPFECVGTPEETKAAFVLAHERGDLDDTETMQMFLNESFTALKNPKKLIEEILKPSKDHAIPKEFQSLVL